MRIKEITSALVVIMLMTGTVFAGTQHDAAEALAKSGDIAGMEAAYRKILEKQPTDTKARLGYATALSWQGKYRDAEAQFNKVLNKEPANLDALIGLGYNQAWNKEFDKAEKSFRKAQKLAPDNLGAQKGLGFTYLWSNQPTKSLTIMEPLGKKYPRDSEIHSAIGQAQLALNKNDAAEVSFTQALVLQPGRPDALSGLAAIRNEQDTFDVIAWAGSTSDGGTSGLRELILAYNIDKKARIWARYDNSLSLDNPALARSGEKVETYYLGFHTSFGNNLRGVIEVGTRDLPSNADQQVYKAEVIHFLEKNVFKLGAQLSPHSDNYTDKLLFTAYNFPVNGNWRMEPALFLSSYGQLEDKEWRAILFTEYNSPQRWSAGFSLGGGNISSDVAANEGSVLTASALFSYPIGQFNRLNFSVRYEDAPTTSYTTVLAGVAISLP